MHKVLKNFTEGERRKLGFILKYLFALTSNKFTLSIEFTKNETPGEKTLWSNLKLNFIPLHHFYVPKKEKYKF